MSSTALLFPGQGAQYVGMGVSLAQELPAAKQLFERADEVLGYRLSEVCFQGPAETLHLTNRSQPGLFVHSMAAMERLKQQFPEGIERCKYVAGLSLGEYTAMVVAGSLGFEDGLRVVQCRGDAMQAAAELVDSGMVSILGLELPDVEQLCNDARHEQEILQVANHLCPGNIVISGHQTACDRAAAMATERGAMRAIPLTVAGAFHTELMRPAVQKLEDALAGVTISSPKIPVISNVDAISHSHPDELRTILVSQVCSAVYWEKSIRLMIDGGVDQFFEIGAGNVLKGLLKRIDRKMPCESIG